MSQATQILVVRHGQTDWNLAQRIQGFTDTPLNATGRTQAEAASEKLRGRKLDAIYSSDLLRAFDTAKIIAAHHKLTVLVELGLRERNFGHFEGQTFTQIEASDPESYTRWRERDPRYAPRGGESLLQLKERTRGVYLRLAKRHPGQCIAVVSHGGSLDMLFRVATEMPLEAQRPWDITNASIGELSLQDGKFEILSWAQS
jgi:2,3-bisphosphoglycerate-dependent phosphoglycerate mutase